MYICKIIFQCTIQSILLFNLYFSDTVKKFSPVGPYFQGNQISKSLANILGRDSEKRYIATKILLKNR